MIGLMVFVLTLPLAVYTYAGCFLLIDLEDRIRAVRLLAARLLAVMLLVIVTPASARPWIGAAFVLVAVLHAVGFVLVRMAINGRWPVQRID